MPGSSKSSNSSTRRSPSKPGPQDQPERFRLRQGELEEILELVGIETWDWLLVGDGSGSDRRRACGFGCISVERRNFESLVWGGAFNRGTVNIAEMLAYVPPLLYIADREEERRKERRGQQQVRHVHIITDSAYCRLRGEGVDRDLRRHSAVWRLFEDFPRQGILLHWHQQDRNVLRLNTVADQISKSCRKLIEAARPLARAAKP